jgi:hypothetical protein
MATVLPSRSILDETLPEEAVQGVVASGRAVEVEHVARNKPTPYLSCCRRLIVKHLELALSIGALFLQRR